MPPRLMTEFKAAMPPPPDEGGDAGAGATAPSASPLGGSKADVRNLKRAASRSLLRSLAARFDDITSLDKLAAAQRRVSEVKAIMATNLALATERDSLLETASEKTTHLNDKARSLFKSSSAIKRAACCR